MSDDNNYYIEDASGEEVEHPQPNREVMCPYCKGTKKKQINSHGEYADYYWRYYRCMSDGCAWKTKKRNYSVGVHRVTNFTIITTKTPKYDSDTRLTSNLAFMLPIGHEAITPDYAQFLASKAQRYVGSKAKPQASKPYTEALAQTHMQCLRCGNNDNMGNYLSGLEYNDPNLDWVWTEYVHIVANCNEGFWRGISAKTGEVQYSLNSPVPDKPIQTQVTEDGPAYYQFKKWLAANLDSLKAAGYTDDQEDAVFFRWLKSNGG